MSSRLFKDDIVFYQRLLKASGYYTKKIDGIWGGFTSKADAAFLLDSEKLKASLGSFDSRTEGHIASLHIKAQEEARKFMATAQAGAHSCRIISGTRSYREQNDLYKKGRWGNPGPIVTRARGGQSNHNFCIAWDIGLFDASGKYLTGANAAERQAYKDVADAADLTHLEWGGSWERFPDLPHYQFDTGKDIASVRVLFEKGKPYI